MKRAKPSDLEMQVLSVLWTRGPSSVRDVLGQLPDRKERAYTTVLTVLRGLERKNLVSHTREGLTHIYQATVAEDEVVRPVIKTLLQNVFCGDPSKVVQALVDSTDVTPEDLKQIRRIINQAARDGAQGDES